MPASAGECGCVSVCPSSLPSAKFLRSSFLSSALYPPFAGQRPAHIHAHPSHTDAQVSTFRRWLDAYGGEVPTCSAEDVKATMSTALPKEQVSVCSSRSSGQSKHRELGDDEVRAREVHTHTCSHYLILTLSPTPNHVQILDRFSQHTRSCSHCLGALKAIDLAIPLCTAVGFVAAVAAIAAQVRFFGCSLLASSITCLNTHAVT